VSTPLLIVLALALAAVIANFVAVLFALREIRRAQQATSESVASAIGAATASAQQMLAAALEETRASNELAQESNELTRRGLEALERSLEISGHALEFSKRSFEVAHQPSLHVVKVETLSGSSSVDTVLSARVSLRNTGTSDAHDVMISGRFHAGPVNIDEVEFPEATGGQTQGFVAPDIVTHGTVQQSLTFELRDANARSGRLFLVCCVRYGDDFGALHLGVFIRVWSGGQWVAVREKRKRVAA
jgi:hypothetical protein